MERIRTGPRLTAGQNRLLKRVAWAGAWLLILVILVFLVIRATTDWANISSGTVPPEGEFDRRYAQNPALAYLHIVPGVVYLLGATIQLSPHIRSKRIRFHRRFGKIVLAAGLLTGFFAILVGIVMPFGGAVQGSATVVFGTYFLASLGLAYRAIRRLDVPVHRRWMIRAFAIGLGVGMIRIWVGLLEATGLFTFARGFGLSFWIALSLHAMAAELWLRIRPIPYLTSPAGP